MPYTNIVFVKLLVELAKDYRFTDRLNDSQKLLYFGLLLLSGVTDNQTPNDPAWIKRALNLQMSAELIELEVIHIREVFDKLCLRNGLLQFEKWETLHNYKIGIPKCENRFSYSTKEKEKEKVIQKEKEKENKNKNKNKKEGFPIPMTDEQRKAFSDNIKTLVSKL